MEDSGTEVENTANHIDDLIGKYLAGEATPDESAFVESWRRQSDHNQRYFLQIKTIFDHAEAVTSTQAFNTEAAWQKVKAQLTKKQETKTVALKPDDTGRLFWRIAASIVVVIGIGFFAYRALSPGGMQRVEVATEKKTETDTLPDGSNVVLNKETKLAYAFDKKKKAHVVKLQGEAYFNVKHKDDKTFIVDVDGIYVRDIGTSFNVKGYPDSDLVEVVVEEGEVIFYTDSDSGIYLQANGKGVYNKTTKKFTVEQPEANVTAYKTRFFIFSDTNLGSVVQTLNNVYDRRITVGKNVEACRLTVTFNNESIEEIVQVISETLSLTVTETSDGFLLDGSGCNP